MSMRSDATELADARRQLGPLVSSLPGGGPAEQAFQQPWHLRAFAIAVAAHQEGHYEWREFQSCLADSIRRWEESDDQSWSYYEHWLNALETVLGTTGLLADPLALDERTRETLATPPNNNHHQAHREPVAVSPAS